MSCPLAAQFQLLPVFQWLVPVKGRAGCESQWWYYLLLKKSGGKVQLTRSTMHHLKWKVSILGVGKKRISQYRLYAKDAWMCLSLCINGVGERIAFHIHNCFYFWFLLPSCRFTVCSTTCVGFTGQSTCPGGNRFHVAQRPIMSWIQNISCNWEKPDVIIFHMATILGGFGLNIQFSKKKMKSGFELG